MSTPYYPVIPVGVTTISETDLAALRAQLSAAQAEAERLRGTLETIADTEPGGYCQQLARAALRSDDRC